MHRVSLSMWAFAFFFTHYDHRSFSLSCPLFLQTRCSRMQPPLKELVLHKSTRVGLTPNFAVGITACHHIYFYCYTKRSAAQTHCGLLCCYALTMIQELTTLKIVSTCCRLLAFFIQSHACIVRKKGVRYFGFHVSLNSSRRLLQTQQYCWLINRKKN